MIVGTLPIGLAARNSAGLRVQSTSTWSYSAPASCSAQRAICPRDIGLVKNVYSAIVSALPRSDDAERRPLRIRALDDPAASGHLMGAVADLAAAALDRVLGPVDVVDAEVIVPVRRLLAALHHGTD